jgi:hypothetical protein
MGVRLMNLAAGDSVVGLARNAESLAEGDAEAADEDDDQDIPADSAEQAEPSDLADLVEDVDLPDLGEEDEGDAE